MASYDKRVFRVTIPSPCHCPQNPLLNEEQSPTKTDDAATVDVQEGSNSKKSTCDTMEREKRIENRRLKTLLHTDQRSFLSGSAALQSCYIINAVRSRVRDTEKDYRRNYIEKYLTELNFRPDMMEFRLDARPNMMLLSCQEHFALDLYGLYAFWLGAYRITALSLQLSKDNKDWSRRVKGDRKAKRNLSYKLEVYDIEKYEWQVLVLYPDRYLPDGEKLEILDVSKRTLRREGNERVPTPNEDDAWHRYFVANKAEVLATDNVVDPPPPVLARVQDGKVLHLKFQNTRESHDQPSLFALMVNLHSKLKTRSDYVTRDHRHHTMLSQVENLMGEIFFKPPGKWPTTTPEGWIDFGEEVPLPKMDQNADVTMPSTKEKDTSGSSQSHKRKKAENEPSDELESFTDEGYHAYEDYYGFGGTCDAELTDEEFDILVARQSSDKLSKRQRVGNAMKILYGPRGRPTIISDTSIFE